MIKTLIAALAIAATTTVTHTTGHLNSKGIYGAWATEKVQLQDGAVNTVHVSASANGKHTYLDCDFVVYDKVVLRQHHTKMCAATVKDLALPCDLVIKLTNENEDPVDYTIDLEVER